MTDGRKRIIDRLKKDLIGPFEKEEVLDSRPSDIYMTGILWPPESTMEKEDDDRMGVSSSDSDNDAEDTSPEEEISASSTMRPSTAGISFAAGSAANQIKLSVEISFSTYEILEEPSRATDISGVSISQSRTRWFRKPCFIKLENLIPEVIGSKIIDLSDFGAPAGVRLHVRSSPWSDATLITMVLVNGIKNEKDADRNAREQSILFQVRIEVLPESESRLIARPQRRGAIDEDDNITSLLYRNVLEYATGHTCSAGWKEDIATGTIIKVSTEWIPEANVLKTDPSGDEIFRSIKHRGSGTPLSAEWLSSASDHDLVTGLKEIPSAYGRWIDKQSARIPSLPESFHKQAQKNLEVCQGVLERMEEGISVIATNPAATRSFRLANKAMTLQYSWQPNKNRKQLEWRPFQLGFILLCLASTLNNQHPDRHTMDLLWFPTGGGKTEAYLALVAFIAFYRRLKHEKSPDNGGGVAAIMRYTLRLLTTQQFIRASAMILACESIRRGRISNISSAGLGETPFSIGLWVGGNATPNSYDDAEKSLSGSGQNASSPRQLTDCPSCHNRLEWKANRSKKSIEVRCTFSACVLYDNSLTLPIFTVDGDVYQNQPTLLIGTVDKFTQIVRREETGGLFSVGKENTPDLVIQDELHLISGPLGTLTGLYEVALDRILSRQGKPAKVIGSTATIRRAKEQIRSLFNRKTCQFPPPALDAGDSGFAITDQVAPGRAYIGVTTAGRSAKFVLQAVAASILQSAFGCFDNNDERDPYWTLIAYFNSLRELGGALVLMQDDVNDTIEMIAKRWNESKREPKNIEELTSRISQMEVRDMLDNLQIRSGNDAALDVVLATNMFSVGVDIPRLGIMLMNGQPKGIAEYIQASSRVGRGNISGLVVSVFNNSKVRDRSHYETFTTWHNSLYRDVEVTSVTPFSSRARDRALHAVLVALIRHILPGMGKNPKLDNLPQESIRNILEYIIKRAHDIDPGETMVEEELEKLISNWKMRSPEEYWNIYKMKTSLLQDSEKAATLEAMGRKRGDPWPTMNNMRSVEPGCMFRMAERLRSTSQGES